MPLFKWRVIFEGGPVDVPSQEKLEQTLMNQSMISGNLVGSVKKFRVETVPASTLIEPAAQDFLPDLRKLEH